MACNLTHACFTHGWVLHKLVGHYRQLLNLLLSCDIQYTAQAVPALVCYACMVLVACMCSHNLLMSFLCVGGLMLCSLGMLSW